MADNAHLERMIFAHIYKVSNMLQVYQDNMLKKYALTAKQFYLMIVIGSYGETSPTLTQVADRFGSSYQNIKQIAIKLEKSDYIEIYNDKADKRMKRLKLTKKAEAFWNERDEADYNSLKQLFKNFKENDKAIFLSYLQLLEEGVEVL